MNLTDYGFLPAMISSDKPSGIPARVTAVHRGRFELICEHGECFGQLKSSVYYGNRKEEFPTTGDFVLINYNHSGDSPIVKTLPRRTFFSRRDPYPGRGEQAVAANFDYVFLVQSLNSDFNLKRMERYLTLAWQSGATPVIVLTKADLAGDCSAQIASMERIASGVDVLPVSSKTGLGLDRLSDFFKPGKTIVFLGSSGVGKSSLVNALAGDEIMGIGAIREEDGKGRHTTTQRQLIMLPSGAMIIDTPGMRELGMWDVSQGLGEAFDDVEQYLGTCRFSDCKHQSEPGCAIKAAIADGKLSPKRWESYLALKHEAAFSSGDSGESRKKRKREQNARSQKPDYRHTACTDSFICKVCGAAVGPEGAGSQHRNHCPNCLSSVHVDNEPGDRSSLCGGIMDPIGIWVRKDGEWAIIHRCRSCGALSSNRIAADDNPALLLSIAVKPLAEPPFPLGQLDRMFQSTPHSDEQNILESKRIGGALK